MKDFVLQIDPRQFKLSESLKNLPANGNLVLGVGDKIHRGLTKGSRVYLWETRGRDLVGRGTVVEDSDPREMPEWQHQHVTSDSEDKKTTDRVVIGVDARLDPPLSREILQQNRVLQSATFFKNKTNTSGTIFNVAPDASVALDDFIAQQIQETGTSEIQRDLTPGIDSDDPTILRRSGDIATRPGAVQFRNKIRQAYENRCAVTECDVEGALQAAHILPLTREGTDNVTNGLLLRADVHLLFDLKLLAFREDLSIAISPRIQATSFGQELAGYNLRLPNRDTDRPNREELRKRFSELRDANAE